jgi:hypothetical protein
MEALVTLSTSISRSFGPWEFCPHTRTLVLRNGGREEGYWIPLELIRTSSEMLDWIFQVQVKRWAQADPAILSGLLEAFAELFVPQATLCPHGANLRLPANWWGDERAQKKPPASVSADDLRWRTPRHGESA